MDPSIVAGDVFVVAEDHSLVPRTLRSAVEQLLTRWSSKGWTTPQLADAFTKLRTSSTR